MTSIILRGLPLITRPTRSRVVRKSIPVRPIVEPVAVCKGLRMVSKQQGSLDLPVTEYRCQIIGCAPRARRKALPQPQIPAYIRDKKWKGRCWEKTERGYQCLLCDKVGNYGAIQQHAKQHFLPEYQCLDCGDAWHIKGQWQQHFQMQCPHCDKTCKGEVNLKKHIATKH